MKIKVGKPCVFSLIPGMNEFCPDLDTFDSEDDAKEAWKETDWEGSEGFHYLFPDGIAYIPSCVNSINIRHIDHETAVEILDNIIGDWCLFNSCCMKDEQALWMADLSDQYDKEYLEWVETTLQEGWR